MTAIRSLSLKKSRVSSISNGHLSIGGYRKLRRSPWGQWQPFSSLSSGRQLTATSDRSDKMKTTNMPKTIELSTTLAASPAKVIEHVCRSALLEYVSRGVLRVVPVEPPRFPEKWSEGQYRANLYLFGFLPVGWQVIGIEPETRCDETWSIRDNGYGWAIKAWDHTMEVTPIGEESYYTDRITLDAGVLTPMVTVFVKLLYGHRQRRWQKLVANDFDYDAA